MYPALQYAQTAFEYLHEIALMNQSRSSQRLLGHREEPRRPPRRRHHERVVQIAESGEAFGGFVWHRAFCTSKYDFRDCEAVGETHVRVGDLELANVGNLHVADVSGECVEWRGCVGRSCRRYCGGSSWRDCSDRRGCVFVVAAQKEFQGRQGGLCITYA